MKRKTVNNYLDPTNTTALYNVVDNNYKWWWCYDLKQSDLAGFIDNPNFGYLNDKSDIISTYSKRDYVDTPEFDNVLSNMGILPENFEEYKDKHFGDIEVLDIKTILRDYYNGTLDYDSILTYTNSIRSDFDYFINRKFMNFMEISNLQKILSNNNINEEILNYAIIHSDCFIIWLQTDKSNYYLVYDLNYYRFDNDEDNAKHYKLYNQEDMKKRFTAENVDIFINDRRITGEKAIIQDKEINETVLVPVRSVLEEIGSEVTYYKDNEYGTNIYFNLNGDNYTIDFPSGLVYSGKKDTNSSVNTASSNVLSGLFNHEYCIIDNKMYMPLASFGFLEKLGYKIDLEQQNKKLIFSEVNE